MNKNKIQKNDNLFYDELKKIITEELPCPVKPPYYLEVNENCFILKKTTPFEILSPITGKLTHKDDNHNQVVITKENKYQLIYELNRISLDLKNEQTVIKNQYIGECKNILTLIINNMAEKKNSK